METYTGDTIFYTKKGFSFDVWIRDSVHGKIHLGRYYSLDFIELFEAQGFKVVFDRVVFDGVHV